MYMLTLGNINRNIYIYIYKYISRNLFLIIYYNNNFFYYIITKYISSIK